MFYLFDHVILYCVWFWVYIIDVFGLFIVRNVVICIMQFIYVAFQFWSCKLCIVCWDFGVFSWFIKFVYCELIKCCSVFAAIYICCSFVLIMWLRIGCWDFRVSVINWYIKIVSCELLKCQCLYVDYGIYILILIMRMSLTFGWFLHFSCFLFDYTVNWVDLFLYSVS